MVGGAAAHETAKLKDGHIEFKTESKGKKPSTRLIIQVYCKDGTIAAKNDPIQTYGEFKHFTDNGPIALAVDGATAKDNVKGGYHMIKIDPVGEENWAFSYTLTLNFDDGTHLVYGRNHRLASQSDPVVRGANL